VLHRGMFDSYLSTQEYLAAVERNRISATFAQLLGIKMWRMLTTE
jgi:hypothetical protein